MSGPFPTSLSNGLQRTEAEFAGTAARLSSGRAADVVPGGEAPFYAYLNAASAAHAAGSASAQPGLDASNAAAGGAQAIGDALQQLAARASAASNDLLAPTERGALQMQADAAVAQIGRIAASTTSGGNLQPAALGIANLDLSTTASAQNALASIGTASAAVTTAQGALGSQAAGLQARIDSNDTIASNLAGLAEGIADRALPAAIQRFKFEATQEDADLVALAQSKKESDVTLGMLDAHG